MLVFYEFGAALAAVQLISCSFLILQQAQMRETVCCSFITDMKGSVKQDISNTFKSVTVWRIGGLLKKKNEATTQKRL